MKRLILGAFLLGAWSPAGAAPAPQFINNGTMFEAVPIDATTFINNGRIDIGTFSINLGGVGFDLNFLTGEGPSIDTLNTLTFINRGYMDAYPGFRFEYTDYSGMRRWADSITNERGATLRASPLSMVRDGNPFHYGDGGYLTLNATNIMSRGEMSVGFFGDLKIQGRNVDIARSAVFAATMPSSFPAFTPTSFGPVLGMEDVWWRYGEDPVNYTALGSSEAIEEVIITPDGPMTNIVLQVTAQSPLFRIENPLTVGVNVDLLPRRQLPTFNYTVIGGQGPGGGGGPVLPPGAGPLPVLTYVWTNTINASNQMITAVFVNRRDTNILVDVGINPSFNPDLPAPSVNVFAGALTTNVIFGGYEVQGLLIRENFGNSPMAFTFQNMISDVTFIPTNIYVQRLAPRQIPISRADVDSGNLVNLLSAESILPGYRGQLGQVTNSTFRDDLFTVGHFPAFSEEPLTFTNLFATNAYVTYAGYISPRPSRLPLLDRPDISVTNLAGRIAIDADVLDMSGTRMQAQGVVNLNARHFISSPSTAIEAPNANFVLGSTNGLLTIQGIVPRRAEGLEGYFGVYVSGWTNALEYEFEVEGEPDPETGEPSIDTETVTVNGIYHYVFVDLQLITAQRVQTLDLKLTAPNVNFNDIASVTRITTSGTTNMTVNGSLYLEGLESAGSPEWDVRNFPNLTHLTINGDVQVLNFMNLGADRALPYDSVVNNGFLITDGLAVRTRDFQSPGIAFISGPIDIVADTFSVDGTGNFGWFFSQNDMRISARELLLDDALLTSSMGVRLEASEALGTGGSGFFSSIVTSYGIVIPSRPPAADLRGALLELDVPKFGDSLVYWPGADMGATPAGFENNLALGGLLLDMGDYSIASFRGPDGRNALYAEFIEFTTDMIPLSVDDEPDFRYLSEYFDIPENFTIYYLSAGVEGVDISLQLDGLLDGRLRRIEAPDIYAGGGASLLVQSGPGSAVQVSRFLRFSARIDSDGDGVVNALDRSPFEGVTLSTRIVKVGDQPLVELSWQGAAGTSYEVQATSNVAGSPWQTLATVRNDHAEPQPLKLHDKIPAGGAVRVYRVVYRP